MVHGITPSKRREAIRALGFDPNNIVSLALGSDYATVLVADLDGDGKPQVVDGVLLTETLNGPVADEEVSDD